MVEIFKLGGVEVTKEEVLKILTKTEDEEADFSGKIIENEEQIRCNNRMFESFLNGLITFKRGTKEVKPGQKVQPDYSIHNHASINNVLLKKVKIALSLTGEDMLDIFHDAGVNMTKGELGDMLRKEGHRNYKPCGNGYARNFLKGLAIQYRDDV